MKIWLVFIAAVFSLLPVRAGDDSPMEPLPQRYLSSYFQKRPKQFLADPQHLLTTDEFQQQLKFLNYHSGDSAIDLQVYLLRGDQTVPSGMNVEDAMDKVYRRGKPSVIVYYFLGRPDRAALYLSPGLNGVVPLSEQNRALETAIEQASNDASPVRQLNRFLVQMSIRIYWMERFLDKAQSVHGEAATESLPKVISQDRPKATKLEQIIEGTKPYWWPAGAGLTLLLLALALRIRLKMNASYRFPELRVEPRLGGGHGAGIGAVIFFASVDQPPASQKDERKGF